MRKAVLSTSSRVCFRDVPVGRIFDIETTERDVISGVPETSTYRKTKPQPRVLTESGSGRKVTRSVLPTNAEPIDRNDDPCFIVGSAIVFPRL